MKKVIIPTDFSENAKHALTQSILFFNNEYCEFYIIHAYGDEAFDNNDQAASPLFPNMEEAAKSKSNERLIELLEYAQETTKNLQHHFKIRSINQSLVDAIDDIVNQENADIIVMGTKGASNNYEVTFGSKTLQVIRYVDCPVLAIPENYQFNKPKNILFPSSLMTCYDKRELKLLNELGMDFSSTIHLLHQITTEELTERKKKNKIFLQDSLYSCEQELHMNKGTDLIKTINDFIEKKSIDIVVMVNSHQSYLEDMLVKTSIDKIGLTSKIPFLVMQNVDRSTC